MPELTAKLRVQLDAWQVETNAPIPAEPNPECILPATNPETKKSKESP